VEVVAVTLALPVDPGLLIVPAPTLEVAGDAALVEATASLELPPDPQPVSGSATASVTTTERRRTERLGVS
jgi:septal ring-binding cell division protein DamX